MDEILLEYLYGVVDKCCEPFDDVAINKVTKEGHNFIVYLCTPIGYAHSVGTSVDISRELVLDAYGYRHGADDYLKHFILSHVEACHNSKNCNVHYSAYKHTMSRDATDALSTGVARLNETFGAFFSRKDAAMPSKTIKKVIFNPPATVVLWEDGSKTVVKVNHEDELFDKEKGLAMAIAKHFLGNDCSSYYDEFRKWVK